jgi:hypothetical protein
MKRGDGPEAAAAEYSDVMSLTASSWPWPSSSPLDGPPFALSRCVIAHRVVVLPELSAPVHIVHRTTRRRTLDVQLQKHATSMREFPAARPKNFRSPMQP